MASRALARSSSPVRLSAAAGGEGGSWFALLEGLVRLVGQRHPEIQIQVVEGGGISNHAQVGANHLPMGILNPPLTVAALAGQPPFDRAYPDLRVAVANLTVNHLHCIAAQEVPLSDLEQWFALKRPLRVPVDRPSTVDRLVFRLALAHYGVTEEQAEGWGSHLIPAANYTEQLRLWRRGDVNALWQFMGIPSPSVAAAQQTRPIKLLPLSESLIADLERRGWARSTMPAGAYGVVAEPIPTVAMGTSLGFHASVPADVVFAIVETICEHADAVRKIHPSASAFDPAQAPLNPGGPLHPGALRCYQSRGLSPAQP